MYEEFYQLLNESEIAEYLDRINMKAPAVWDREALDELIRAHQYAVPFENLNLCMLNRPVTIDIPTLFQKIVRERRGGYCFEMNGMFHCLLKSLGYDASCCMARVVRGKTSVSPMLHRANFIKWEGKTLFADVGFGGPQPAGAIVFEENTRQTVKGETFFFYKRDEWWWRLARESSSGEIEDVLEFTAVPHEPIDFMVLNEYTATNPNSMFRQVMGVNLRTPTGNIALNDGVLTINDGGEKTERPVADEELKDVLKEYFGLVV